MKSGVVGLAGFLLSMVLYGTAAGAAQSIALGLLVPSQPGVIADDGIAGARLAIDDNNTTGKFLGQSFSLDEITVADTADPAAAVHGLTGRGRRFIISLLPADQVVKAADGGGILVNAAALDDRLRGPDCRANLLHTMPSRAMLTDALAQYLVLKRWTKWFLTLGATPADLAFADDLRRSAKRFGARIIAEKPWTFDADSKPESEVPVFTQGADYDVVATADEGGAFGQLLPYRTWLPRPVVGTSGLVPAAWDATAEDWGAIQLQNRFRKLAGRPMTSVDYAAWLAVRAIGEAASRARSGDADAIAASLRAEDFTVAGFKGRKLSFRPWDGQMRQPIFLSAANGVVAVAPVDGFMHPRTELDSLGVDQPETQCRKDQAK